MNFRSSGAAARLLAVAAAALTAAAAVGCGTVTASQPGAGAQSTASPGHATASATAKQTQAPSAATATPGAGSGCQLLAGGVLTLASNGNTYCVRVGERFEVYLRGTVASRWLVPLASSDVIVPVPNGALSPIAGLTGESFAGTRPGKALITSVRAPCAGAIMQKNYEAEPASPVPKTYRLSACAPQRRFSVTIIVTR